MTLNMIPITTTLLHSTAELFTPQQYQNTSNFPAQKIPRISETAGVSPTHQTCVNTSTRFYLSVELGFIGCFLHFMHICHARHYSTVRNVYYWKRRRRRRHIVCRCCKRRCLMFMMFCRFIRRAEYCSINHIITLYLWFYSLFHTLITKHIREQVDREKGWRSNTLQL